MSAGAVEGVPQTALGVLLDMFYGLSALRQVLPLAASKGAQAAAPVELSKEQLGPAVTACWENVGGSRAADWLRSCKLCAALGQQ